jgi:acyl-CoA synthetase (NDP forming)
VGDAVLDAIFKQLGIIRVYSMDELIDVILPFLYMSPPKGRNVGVVGTGGGASVQIADECERMGLHVPKLPPDVKKKLSETTPEAGSILGNPFDSSMAILDANRFGESIQVIAGWEGIDLMILHRGLSVMSNPGLTMRTEESRRETYLSGAQKCGKPTAIVLHSVASTAETWEVVGEWQMRCNEVKLPLYPSLDRAANAVNKFIEYHEQRMKRNAFEDKKSSYRPRRAKDS